MKLDELLKKLNACNDAVFYAEGKTLEQAWNECVRGDWMLWLAQKLGVPEKGALGLAKCAVVRQVWHLMANRSKNAVEIKEKWCRGEATDEEMQAAVHAAEAAASADAAARAAWAAWAAWAAANAAWAAWAAAEETASLKSSAEIVRREIPLSMMLELAKKQGYEQ
jgi:hypothetical protein